MMHPALSETLYCLTDLELEEVRDDADVGAGDDKGGGEEGELLQEWPI